MLAPHSTISVVVRAAMMMGANLLHLLSRYPTGLSALGLPASVLDHLSVTDCSGSYRLWNLGIRVAHVQTKARLVRAASQCWRLGMPEVCSAFSALPATSGNAQFAKPGDKGRLFRVLRGNRRSAGATFA